MVSACLLGSGAVNVKRVFLSQGEQVAALRPELHEIALPVTKLLSGFNSSRPFMDGRAARNRVSATLEIVPSARRLGPRQEAVQLLPAVLSGMWLELP